MTSTAQQPDLDPGQPLDEGRSCTSSSPATRKAAAASARDRGPASSRSTSTRATRATRTTPTPTPCSARSATTRRSTPISEVIGKRYIGEAYVQDTWKATRSLTLDYGVRFLWYTPWYSTQPAAVFVPERYDPAKAPRLYQPAVVNGANVALDPVTGETKANVFVGSFVPGTGDRYNGMVTSSDPNYPKGFRDSQGIEPEPRVGLAWDLTGDGKTALHASAGLVSQPARQRERPGRDGQEPPRAEHAEHQLRDHGHAPRGRRGWRVLESPERRVRHRAGRQNAEELQLLGRRPARAGLGHGGGRDVRGVPDAERGNEREHQLGARRRPVPRRQPAEPQSANGELREAERVPAPYLGYQDITIRSHFGTGSYNSLQVQLNRRYIRGLQLGVAYTLAKTISDGTRKLQHASAGGGVERGPHRLDPVAQPRGQLHMGRAEREPSLGQPADARAPRRLAGVGRHGGRERRLVGRQQPHHDRQLRLHGRRRGHAGEDLGRRDVRRQL